MRKKTRPVSPSTLAAHLVKQRLQAAKGPVAGLKAGQYKKLKTTRSAPKLKRRNKVVKQPQYMNQILSTLAATARVKVEKDQPNGNAS